MQGDKSTEGLGELSLPQPFCIGDDIMDFSGLDKILTVFTIVIFLCGVAIGWIFL